MQKTNQTRFVFFLTMVMLFSCSPKPQVYKEVSYTREGVTFVPEAQTKQVKDGLILTVQPVDAVTLNRMTYYSATRRGDYESEFARTYHFTDDVGPMSRSERARQRVLREMSEKITERVKNGTMSAEMGYLLMQRITEGEERGFDASESRWFRAKERYTNRYNPFFVGNNYLSVFSLQFENISSEVATVEISSFQVASGTEVIYPYKMSTFEEIFKDSRFRQFIIDNAIRYNMPNRLNITPGQKVEKFLAVPAISRYQRDVAVQFLGDDRKSENYTYEVNYTREEKKIPLKKYSIRALQSQEPPHRYKAYYIIQFENELIIPLKSNYLYISDLEKNQDILLCGMVEYTTQDMIFLGCLNINPSNLAGNDIFFPMLTPHQ